MLAVLNYSRRAHLLNDLSIVYACSSFPATTERCASVEDQMIRERRWTWAPAEPSSSSWTWERRSACAWMQWPEVGTEVEVEEQPVLASTWARARRSRCAWATAEHQLYSGGGSAWAGGGGGGGWGRRWKTMEVEDDRSDSNFERGYFTWSGRKPRRPTFWNGGSISLSRDSNKWLYTKQNEWIYPLKYVYIHPYIVVCLKCIKRLIFRNGGSMW